MLNKTMLFFLLLVLFLSLSSSFSEYKWCIYEHNLTTANLNYIDRVGTRIVGDDGVLLEIDYPTDGKSTEEWWEITLPTQKDLYGITDYWSDPIVGEKGTVLNYESGEGWEFANTHIKKSLFSVYPYITYKNNSNGFIVGEEGSILFYENNDRSEWFLYEPTPTMNDLYSIDKSYQGNDIWAVGENGTILYYENNYWYLYTSSPTTSDLFSVYIDDDTMAWACGADGTILKWNGSNWAIITTPTSEDLHSIFYEDYQFNKMFCVGANGTILKSSDLGATWILDDSPVSIDLYSVGGAFGVIWAVGENGTIIHLGEGFGSIQQCSIGSIKTLFDADIGRLNKQPIDSNR